MALAKVEVNIPAVENIVSSLESDSGAIEKVFQSMYDSVLELNGMWTGEAASTFQGQAASDYEILMEISESIIKMMEQYRAACNEYRNCEEAVAAAIAAIRV